jgi:ATP-dependent Clp protease ATP-binding subunit ClpX
VKDDDSRGVGEMFTELEPEDLLKFGLIPEFVGRLPVIATLTDLDEEALVTILTEPKNALVKQYQRLFELEDVEADLHRGRAERHRQAAIARKTGARGLRSIMEDILLDTMFELPGADGVEEVVVNEEAVTSDVQPLMIYAERKKDESASAGPTASRAFPA